MLSITEEHLIGSSDKPGLNPQAQLRLYRQEWNDHSYAVCKSDLFIKGYDSSSIQLGDTLADDRFPRQTFEYCMSNLPYGDEWKARQTAVMEDLKELGNSSRFYFWCDQPRQNIPAVSDGQILFLQHVVSKLRPEIKGEGRGGIFMNGSPLFNDNAESGVVSRIVVSARGGRPVARCGCGHRVILRESSLLLTRNYWRHYDDRSVKPRVL